VHDTEEAAEATTGEKTMTMLPPKPIGMQGLRS
jgi:hypothetical protein